MKKILQIIFKVIVACGVLALVLHKAESGEIWKNLRSINTQALTLAFILAMISHVVTALRMRVFLHPLKIDLQTPYACKIYFIGSLFNLILPTGVGGDAVKAWAIRKYYHSTMAPIIKALILDRASGLLVLCFIILGYVVTFGGHIPFAWMAWAGFPITVAVYFILAQKLFGQRHVDGVSAFWYSLVSQAFWCAAIFVLAQALGGNENNFVYVFLYAVAGIVSLLPVTIGGLGLREMTFFYGATWLAQHAGIGADAERGVAISLAYFAIYVVTSAVGALVTVFIKNPIVPKMDVEKSAQG